MKNTRKNAKTPRGLLSNRRRQTKRSMPDTNHTSFTKMNCSPAVKGFTPVKDSCITMPILIQLRDYYNNNYPNSRITSDEPNVIWNELKDNMEKMKQCYKEDCWLNLIEIYNKRKTIDDYLFAPDQPASWKKKPHTWLNTTDIYKVLRQYEYRYPNFCTIRPTPIDFDTKIGGYNGSSCVTDELCKFDVNEQLSLKKTKIGIVFNLDEHDEPGSHWVSLYIDLDDNFAFYMDSAGDSTPTEIKKLVERIQEQCLMVNKKIKFYENHPMQHQYGSTECGVYSLFFIITMLTGETDLHKFKSVKHKINFFKNKRIPDKYISKFRELYFNA